MIWKRVALSAWFCYDKAYRQNELDRGNLLEAALEHGGVRIRLTTS